MSTTTSPIVKFAGDEHPETIRSKDQIVLVRDGLKAALDSDLLMPKTAEQVQKALAFIPSTIVYETILNGPATAAVVAGLIVAESDLNDRQPESDDHKLVQRALRATGRRLIEQGSKRGWLPYDIFFIAWADDLDHYNFPDWLKGKVESIEEIRYFDRNSVTHLCSFTGNYYARFHEMRTTIKPEFDDDNGELRERADDWVREANNETDDDYLEQSSVDALLERNERFKVYHWGNPGIDLDEARDQAWDKAKYAIKSTRETANYWRKERKEPLLPVDDATITALANERFADEGQADEDVTDFVMEAVREANQGNPCL